VPVTSFLNHGNEILSLAPILEVALVIDDETSVIRHWNDLLPDLTNCSALARVRGLSLDSRADFDFVSMKHIIRSAHIESLVRLSPGVWRLDSPHALEEEDEMWSLLLNSPVFRRMVDWGLRTEVTDHRAGFYAPTVTSLLTRRQLGDRMVKEPYGTSGEVTRFEQMSEESRALEQKYGYIPYFHAGNWTATVLDVLQGRKPEFPAGAAPTKEMYDVPPTRDHADTGW
jgi:hypothetical protein